MRSCLLTVVFALLSFVSFSQVASTTSKEPDPNKKLLTVEASCGLCNFGLPAEDCELAVRIDGKAYDVEGVSVLEYGHPHHKGGFCVAVRKAEVQGEVVNGIFKATYFKLLPDSTDTPSQPENKK